MRIVRSALLCLCFALFLAGCDGKEGANSSMSTSNTLYPSTQMPNADEVLDMNVITLEKLLEDDHSYVLLTRQGGRTFIYRFFAERQSMAAYVECYETEAVTREFFSGGAVSVVSAHRNSMNYADWQIVNTRFTLLRESGATASLERLSQHSGNEFSYIIGGSAADALDLNTLNCGESIAAEGDDKGLLYLLRMIYDTRGTGVQLCGPGK